MHRAPVRRDQRPAARRPVQSAVAPRRRVAAPLYTHAGRFRTLREVLEHYNRAPRARVGHSELHPLDLSDAQLDDLEAVLRTLDGGVTAPKGYLRAP